MSRYVRGLTKLPIITLVLVIQSIFLIQYSVKARRLRNVTALRISQELCQYAEAVPNNSFSGFANWIVTYTYRRGGDVDDINAVLFLLKRRCPLDLTQGAIDYLQKEESVQAIILDMRISSTINSLCEDARDTTTWRRNDIKEFQESVLDATSSLDISNGFILNLYYGLEEECEWLKPVIDKASEEDREKANEALNKYGYQSGMTYGEFREILINRGWQPANEHNQFADYYNQYANTSHNPYPDYKEVLCSNIRLCYGSFISNQNRLSVIVRSNRNDESGEKAKLIIPTDLYLSKTE